MAKVVCFGEIMLRLNPEGYLRFSQADKFVATFGGAEANVAVSLSNYGINSSFVTKLPTNDIGEMAIRSLRKENVAIDKIIRGGDRVGIYYLEKGASQRSSKVIYDRKYSAISMAQSSDFDWDAIFEDADWFHFTGITPALGENVAAICEDACRAAKAKGITISCDSNFRKNLWTKEQAGLVMENLMHFVDVCISNQDDADKLFGIQADADHIDARTGNLDHDGYCMVAKKLAERFGCNYVALTLRRSISADDNDWAGMLYSHATQESYFSKKYRLHIVDRVGGGDSFVGGLLYAMQGNNTLQDVIEFAVAASCLKHSIEYDYNQVTVAEVESLMNGNDSGRVQR